MSKLQKIVFFSLVSLSLFFVTHAKETMVPIAIEKTANFSDEGLHAMAFIQPESIQHFIPSEKNGDHNFVKFPVLQIFRLVSVAKLQFNKSFIFQDIDRCESVSLLLFPYHIFW